MTKHKKGSILSIIGLLVVLVIAVVVVFSMISDQIFFKKVNQQEKVEQLNITLDKASKKQIDNYTSQQIPNKNNDSWRDASSTEINAVKDSSNVIESETKKYKFLELDKYQGVDENRINRMLIDNPVLSAQSNDFIKAAIEKHVNEVYLISHT